MAKKKASSAKKVVKKNIKKAIGKKITAKPVKKAVAKKSPNNKSTAQKASVKKVFKKAVSVKTVNKKTSASSKAKKPAVKKTSAGQVKSKAARGSLKKTNKKTISAAAKTPVKKGENKQPHFDFSKLVTPLDDRILVQISGSERMTAGGLFIPDTVSDVSGNLQGKVVAIGRGRMNKKGHVRPMDVSVGDKVVFSEFSGSKVKIQNEELVILREEDVMGVVSK